MRILFFSHYSGMGGANNELLWLCQELKRRKNTVLVVLPTHGEFEKILNQSGIPYRIYPFKRWICIDGQKNYFSVKIRKLLYYFQNWLVAFIIKNKIGSESFDIIHTNDSLVPIGAYVSKITQTPHIWHLRELLEEDYKRTIIYSDQYIRKLYSNSDYMVAISHTVSEKYRHRISRNNLIQIYDGIPVPKNIPYINSIPKGNIPTLLYTGGTSIEKGFEDIINIANILKNKYRISFRILIAGDCSDKGKYNKKIFEYGIQKEIVYLGFVNNLDEIRTKSDIFLMPSIKEAFGLVTVEAMLFGLIVVGRATGGTKEIIQDGINGYLYESGNFSQACSKIIYALKHPNISKKMCLRAQDDVINKYSIARVADEIVNVYRNCKN